MQLRSTAKLPTKLTSDQLINHTKVNPSQPLLMQEGLFLAKTQPRLYRSHNGAGITIVAR